MSSTSTPTTFADLQTACANRLRVNASDSATLTIIKRMLNEGLHDLHIQQNWPWAERVGRLLTHATYSTGTVSISTSARTTVTGSSTLWNTAVTGYGFNNTRAGGKMMFGGPDIYTVATVTNDTSITLASRYVGDTSLSGSAYTYFEDEYALEADFWRTVDVRRFGSGAMRLPIMGRQDFYRQFPDNYRLGTPARCTLIDLGPGSTVDPRPRIILNPVPPSVINIPYRYITTYLAVSSAGVGQTNLSADSDEPIIPLRYRHVLMFYVLAHWYRDRKDDQRSQEANGEYTDLVRRMAGDAFPEKDNPRFTSNRRQYLAGAAGYARRGGRFTTGTRFETFQD